MLIPFYLTDKEHQLIHKFPLDRSLQSSVSIYASCTYDFLRLPTYCMYSRKRRAGENEKKEKNETDNGCKCFIPNALPGVPGRKSCTLYEYVLKYIPRPVGWLDKISSRQWPALHLCLFNTHVDLDMLQP